MSSPYVYFSKMFQAVPQLMEVQKYAGGTFVSTRRSTLMAARKLYPDVPMEKCSLWLHSLSAGYKTLTRAQAIVTGSPGRDQLARFPAKKCMVFHGTYMFLSEGGLSQMTHFDLLCATGPRMRNTIERCQEKFQLHTVESGYLPFGSYPEKTAAISAQSLTQMGLNPEKRTVVYMPWGRPYGSWRYMAEKIIRETPSQFNLILRPHPSHGVTSRRSDRQSFRHISKLCRARGHTLLDLNTLPLPHLYSLADLMITDGTSPAEESLFYDVPQLFIETPLWNKDVIYDYACAAGMHKDDMEGYFGLFDCGVVYRDQQDGVFARALEDAFAASETLHQAREEYFAWVFGTRDRLAGERVYRSLQALTGRN